MSEARLERIESMSDQIRLLAEKVDSQTETMNRQFAELRAEMRELMAPLTLAVTSHSTQLLDHDVRIKALEGARSEQL